MVVVGEEPVPPSTLRTVRPSAKDFYFFFYKFLCRGPILWPSAKNFFFLDFCVKSFCGHKLHCFKHNFKNWHKFHFYIYIS